MLLLSQARATSIANIHEKLLLVTLSGFEPEQTEPKSVVLPLHHRAIIEGEQKRKSTNPVLII